MPNTNLSRTNNADVMGVRELQIALNEHGASLYVDGRFARGTDLALAKFQADNKLDVSGVADEATWAKLQPKKKAPAKKKTTAKKAPAKKAPAKKASPQSKTKK